MKKTIQILLSLTLLISSCGLKSANSVNNGEENPPTNPAAMYTIGGTVTGLQSGNITLQNNGADTLSVSSNGNFTFAAALQPGEAYHVSISATPSGHICNITREYGLVGSNITDVAVICNTAAFSVGGVLTGLQTGKSVTIQNEYERLTLNTNATWVFSNLIVLGGSYTVTVLEQPAGQVCKISNGVGWVSGAAGNVNITCLESIPPNTTVSVNGYIGKLAQTVTLSCTDNLSGCKRIVYTTDGTTPTISPDGLTVHGTEVSGNTAMVSITADTDLDYLSEDNDGNKEPHKKRSYVISNSGIMYKGGDGLYAGAGINPASFKKIGFNLIAVGPHSLFYDNQTGVLYYAAYTDLVFSTNGGTEWHQRTTGSGGAWNVFAQGNLLAYSHFPWKSMEISTDGGNTFSRKSMADGLGGVWINEISASNGIIYVATYPESGNRFIPATGGLAISTNGGVSFTIKTKNDGLGDNSVNGVQAVGSTVYASTIKGLSISTNGGLSFVNKISGISVNDVFISGNTVYAATINGVYKSIDNGGTFTKQNYNLISNYVNTVYVNGQDIYTATSGGLSVSHDGGATFAGKTTADGLGHNTCFDLHVNANTIIVATNGGLSTSTDGGLTFTNKKTSNGLGGFTVKDIYAANGRTYVATTRGLGVSTDGGLTFSNKTTVNGLVDNLVQYVRAAGSMVYALMPGGYSNGFGDPIHPGGLGISTDGGLNFSTANVVTSWAGGVCLSGSSYYFTQAAGIDHGFSYTTDNGQSFTFAPITGADYLNDLYVSGNVILGLDYFYIYFSTDSGATYSLIDLTAVSTDQGVMDLSGQAFERVYYANGVIYLGFENIGIFYSADNGASFTQYTGIFNGSINGVPVPFWTYYYVP